MSLFNNISKEELASKDGVYSKIFGEEKSLANLLTYDHFIDDTGLMITTDGYIGVGYEVNLMDYSPLTNKETVDVYKQFVNFFSLPEETIFQFIFSSSTNDRSSQFYSNPKDDDILRYIRDERLSSHQTGTQKKGYLFLKFRITKEDPLYFFKNPLSLFIKQRRMIKDSLELAITRVRNSLDHFKELNRSSVRELDQDEVFTYIRNTLNNIDHEVSINKETRIKDQLTFSQYQANPDSFYINKKENKLLSIKNYPSSEESDSPDITIGSLIDTLNELAERKINYSYFINGEIVNKQKDLSPLYGYKTFFLLDDEISIERKQHREELSQVSSDINNSSKYVKFSTHIICDNNSTRKIISTFKRTINANIVEEFCNSSGLYLSSLPFQYDPLMNLYNGRSKLFRADQLVHLLPFWEAYKGHPKGNLFVKNRDNKTIMLNLETSNSGHVCVLGFSGTGKSTLISLIEIFELISNPNAYIFKIDSNTTSQVRSNIIKTSLNTFSEDSFPMNPFNGAYDSEKIKFLTNFLILAIKINNPRFETETEHIQLLEQSIVQAFNQKSKKQKFKIDPKTFEISVDEKAETNISLSLDDIIVKMNELASAGKKNNIKDIASVISSKLSIYYGNGLQSHLFKGGSTKLDKDIRSYIYDFQSIDQKSPFLELISMAMTFDIQTKIKELKRANPDVGGLIIFEEIGVFGNNKIVSDYFKLMSETVRKQGFRIISSTPRMQSFFDTEIGKVALQTSEQFLISSLGKSNVNDLINNLNTNTSSNNETKAALEDSIFNEGTISLLKSLKKTTDYSEFLYLNISGDNTGVFRYHPTPIELWLSASGNNKMNSQYNKQLKINNGNHNKTLIELCAQYPKGIS